MIFQAKSKKSVETSNLVEVPHIIVAIRAGINVEHRSTPVVNEHTLSIMQMVADDLDHCPMPGSATWSLMGGEFNLFSNYHAEAVLSLIRATNPEAVVCHCAAGQSRSAGLAAALSKFYNGEDKQFFHMPYTPNMLVYRTMLNYLEEQHETTTRRKSSN
jgi:hypothetical protein